MLNSLYLISVFWQKCTYDISTTRMFDEERILNVVTTFDVWLRRRWYLILKYIQHLNYRTITASLYQQTKWRLCNSKMRVKNNLPTLHCGKMCCDNIHTVTLVWCTNHYQYIEIWFLQGFLEILKWNLYKYVLTTRCTVMNVTNLNPYGNLWIVVIIDLSYLYYTILLLARAFQYLGCVNKLINQ